MRQSPGNGMELKRNNKIRTAKFISDRRKTSKAEIAAGLKLSMPTTLANVKELIEAGIIVEEGTYESTGGRRAKALSIRREAGYAVGVDITNNHITMVMADARKDIAASERIRQSYENTPQYYDLLIRTVSGFIRGQEIDHDRIAGIGFSLPGIVDRGQDLLIRSHTLQVQNVSMKSVGNALGYPFSVENDANSAAFAELGNMIRPAFRPSDRSLSDYSLPAGSFSENPLTDAVYLSLSNTVGGAVYMGGALYRGGNYKSAEFGHMVIEKNGRSCYCGKKGCMDAYCSALILQRAAGGSLEKFFGMVREKDSGAVQVWERYLDALALSVTNLRMIFDCPLVLGGYVGGYLGEFMPQLSRKVMEYNNFDPDTSYLYTGKYKYEASAYGAALAFIDALFENV